MNTKILVSLLVIGLTAIAIGGTMTGAFFSDTETSNQNTFTAGAIDLKVDSECTYNGAPSAQCGTWALKDLNPTSDKFFSFGDIKPGDYGENTISLHVINNDAWVCAAVSNLENAENGCTEPESSVDQSCDNPGVGQGELQQKLVMTVWRDTDCDNVLDEAIAGYCYFPEGPDPTCAFLTQYGEANCLEESDGLCAWASAIPGEAVLATGQPVNGVLPLYDSTTGNGPLQGGTTACLGISWELPAATGNEVQTDSLTGDISFNVVQARNNGGFKCNLN